MIQTVACVCTLICRESDVARWPSPSRGQSSAAHWQVWCRGRHRTCRLAPSPIRGVASGWLSAAVRCGQSSGSVAVLVAAVEMSVSASRVSAVAGRQCGGPRSGGGTEGAAAGSFPRARLRHLGVAGGDVRGGVAVVAVAYVRVERGGRHWGTVSAVEARLGPACEAERPLSSTRPVPSANWLTRSSHERTERPQLPR